LGTSSAALAHAHLQTHYPASDAEVTTAPKVITLDFSEGIEPNFSGVKVTGPDQAVVKTGKAQRSAQDEKQLIVPVEATLQQLSTPVIEDEKREELALWMAENKDQLASILKNGKLPTQSDNETPAVANVSDHPARKKSDAA